MTAPDILAQFLFNQIICNILLHVTITMKLLHAIIHL